MSPRRQQLIIAKACGITGIVGVTGRGLVYGVRTERGVEERRVPDYLHDLNAMNEAEKIIVGSGLAGSNVDVVYHRELQRLCFDKLIWHATAAQRAEAFLRCIGKWEGGA